MWLFITTNDRYERALSLSGGNFYLNYDEDDNGNEDRRQPYIEIAYPTHRFVVKFEPVQAAEQFYQRLKSAIKINRQHFDNAEEGFVVSYFDEEATEMQVSAYEDALPVRQVR
ncbi:MAG TPA: hypothetical protein VKT77_09475 [Chthonomonadaceae bacterium]|nr:hypothetical protein [Chthonomonadaceae bacterium]